MQNRLEKGIQVNTDEFNKMLSESGALGPSAAPLPLKPGEARPGYTPKPHPVYEQPRNTEGGVVGAPLRGKNEHRLSRRRLEQPWHRVAYEMKMNGFTDKDIAAKLGKVPQTVHDVLHNPNYLNSFGIDIHDKVQADMRVHDIIAENVVKAIEVYVGVIDNPQSKPKDKMTAAEAILERRYGKASEPIGGGNVVDLNDLPDSELAKRIAGN